MTPSSSHVRSTDRSTDAPWLTPYAPEDSAAWVALARLGVDLADADDLDRLGELFQSRVARILNFPMRAIHLFGPEGHQPAWSSSHGLSERYLMSYERLGRHVDVELREVLRSASPVYNLSFRTVEQWRSSEFYQVTGELAGMAQIIKAPIVVRGAVIGTVDFATPDERRQIRQVDIDLASALATVVAGSVVALRRRQHVEVELATIRAALDGSSVAVMWVDPTTHKPHVTSAGTELVGDLEEGTEILYRIIRDLALDPPNSNHSYLVRHRDGTRDVLDCTVRAIPGANEVIELSLETAKSHGVNRELTGLSPRELDVAWLVAAALSDREIADELVLSPHTVRQHVKNIYLKLSVNNRVELTRLVLGRTPRAV